MTTVRTFLSVCMLYWKLARNRKLVSTFRAYSMSTWNERRPFSRPPDRRRLLRFEANWALLCFSFCQLIIQIFEFSFQCSFLIILHFQFWLKGWYLRIFFGSFSPDFLFIYFNEDISSWRSISFDSHVDFWNLKSLLKSSPEISPNRFLTRFSEIGYENRITDSFLHYNRKVHNRSLTDFT